MNERKTTPVRQPGQNFPGSVWVYSLDPILCLGMRSLLETSTDVYCSLEVPAEADFSCVICPYGGDVASKLRRLQNLVAEVPILVFGLCPDLALVRTSVQEGACGFTHAGMRPTSITLALALASRGAFVVPRGIMDRTATNGEHPADLAVLSLYQLDMLRMVREGMDDPQIAQRLSLSESAVKRHLRDACEALGTKDRDTATELVGRGA